jgi:PhzF family phenazine biosynthesis protein
MKLSLYQVDAFASERFKGNPAAVCPLNDWLSDSLMQQIAQENNLAETAFIVPKGENYEIRWFTPTVEVDLCGHATLASAFVVFHELGYSREEITFFSPRSGKLTVKKNGAVFVLNFPVDTLTEIPFLQEHAIGLSIPPRAVFKGKTDYLFVYDSEADIQSIVPDFDLLKSHAVRGIIVTAKGDEVDFVSRFFGPACGVNEDPVTGSAHTTLTPYWAAVLGKTEMNARQLSQRTGELHCRLLADRVEIAGECVLYLRGEIEV